MPGTKKDITKRKTPIGSTLKSLLNEMSVYLKGLIFRVICTLKVETCSGTLSLVSKFVVPVPVWRSVTRPSETTLPGVVRYVSVKSKLQHPPRAYPGHLTSSPVLEGGNLINLVFPGAGI